MPMNDCSYLMVVRHLSMLLVHNEADCMWLLLTACFCPSSNCSDLVADSGCLSQKDLLIFGGEG